MKYLVDELCQSGLDLMKTIKESLDPEYVFNPGKLVPMQEV
jgi:glycolate oxidase